MTIQPHEVPETIRRLAPSDHNDIDWERARMVKRYPPGTPERVAEAVKRARAKKASEYAAVAELLHCSRSSAQYQIDKAKRLGLIPILTRAPARMHTFKVEDEIWEKAADIAALNGTSVSALIVDFLVSLDYRVNIKKPKKALHEVDRTSCIHDPKTIGGLVYCRICGVRLNQARE
jgi:hypothetical protein